MPFQWERLIFLLLIANEERGWGLGCGQGQLAATVPCALFPVDKISQCRGAHSLWPCSVNILEHYGCSCGSRGALNPFPRGSWTSECQSQSSIPPNSFSTMAEITLTTNLGVEIPETSENPTCYAPWHQQQKGYPKNKECVNTHTCVTVCVFTHTNVALARSYKLIGQSREGERFKIGASGLCFFKGSLVLVLDLTPFLATWGP